MKHNKFFWLKYCQRLSSIKDKNFTGFTLVKCDQRSLFGKFRNFTGFTLIELLIVIGIIAILAAAVIIAINPGQQFAQARDATRHSHINYINNALLSYQIDHMGSLTGLAITTSPQEICQTGAADCIDLVDLSGLSAYISKIPIDPKGGVSPNGTGYFVAYINGDIVLVANSAETRWIGRGITESEYGSSDCGDDLTDARDGQIYATIGIGDQCWMAENLNIGEMLGSTYTFPSDNSSIEKWCYDNNTSNCNTYGGFYSWNEMMQWITTEGTQGICPDGWHIPSKSEWNTLENHLVTDGNTCYADREGSWNCDPAGGKLKEAGTVHWNTETCGSATCNSSGFTALPGGMREGTGAVFLNLGSSGYWGSSTEYYGDDYDAWYYSVSASNSTIYQGKLSKVSGLSVRCLKD